MKKYLFLALSLFVLSGCDEPRKIPVGMEEVPENEYLLAKTYDRIKRGCKGSVIGESKIAYNCESKEVIIEEAWHDGDGKRYLMIKYWDASGREQYQQNAPRWIDRDLRPIDGPYKNEGAK